MLDRHAPGDDGTDKFGSKHEILRRYCVAASVTDDLIAAVEGWRRAHGLAGQPEALGELVRLGLMSEVAKIYRMVCQDGQSDDPSLDGQRKRRRQPQSRRCERREHGLPAN